MFFMPSENRATTTKTKIVNKKIVLYLFFLLVYSIETQTHVLLQLVPRGTLKTQKNDNI